MTDTKGTILIILSVICIGLLILFVSLAVGLQKKENSRQSEIAKRLVAEEQLQKSVNESNALKSELEKVKKDLEERVANSETITKALTEEKLKLEELKGQLGTGTTVNNEIPPETQEVTPQ